MTLVQKKASPTGPLNEAPYLQDPDERADKAEDDMWYVLQENDELKAKIEVHC